MRVDKFQVRNVAALTYAARYHVNSGVSYDAGEWQRDAGGSRKGARTKGDTVVRFIHGTGVPSL